MISVPRRRSDAIPGVSTIWIRLASSSDGVSDDRGFDPAEVVRVPVLADEAGELGERPLDLAGLEPDEQPLRRSVAKDGHHRCNRKHPYGQELRAEQRVDERGLPAVELPEHDDVEAGLGEALTKPIERAEIVVGENRRRDVAQLADKRPGFGQAETNHRWPLP